MAGIRKADLFKGYTKEHEPDLMWLSELVLRAKGERSLSAFADDCGLDISTLSRIINRKNNGPSSDEVLARIALNVAPESEVTIDDLLLASGKEQAEGAPCAEETLHRLDIPRKPTPDKSDASRTSIESAIKSNGEIAASEQKRCTWGTELSITALDTAIIKPHISPMVRFRQPVLDALIMLNCEVALAEDLVAIRDVISPREALFKLKTNALKAENLDEWAFIELKRRGISASVEVKQCFGEMFVHNPVLDGTRVTMLIEDESTYDILEKSYQRVKIPASFSLMHVDTKNRQVLSEYVFERSDGVEPVRLFHSH